MTIIKTLMEAGFETLEIHEPDKHVLLVTLNRPDFANAFNTKMAEELVEVFEAIGMSPEETYCVVLTGAGTRAFCAGGDLKQRLDMDNEAWFAQHLVFERMTRALVNCPVPLIAAVNGAAYGGGCELVCAADFAYASENAKFALTETTLGIIPGAGGTQTLARAIGIRRAREVIFTGKPFNAQEALEWGLINQLLPQENLLGAVLATAGKIVANAPIAIRQAKSAISRGYDLPLEEGLRFEIEAYNRTVPTKDRYEGVRAFNEKRKADFNGR